MKTPKKAWAIYCEHEGVVSYWLSKENAEKDCQLLLEQYSDLNHFVIEISFKDFDKFKEEDA